MNVLKMQKRGCDFETMHAAFEMEHSDIGNFRVFTRFTGKNGENICGDFMLARRFLDNARRNYEIYLATDLQVDLFKNNRIEAYCWNFPFETKNYAYTKADILKAINQYSTVQYDTIEFVEHLD